jgi:hypothetical protein
MVDTTVKHVKVLVESVLVETNDKDHQFRLRTALQLLELIEEQQDAADKALADCEMDEQTRQNLRKLGYLE